MGRDATPGLRQADYTRLLRFRTALRRFEHWSAEQAAAWGLTAAQHQLLLAVRGHDGPEGPTIGEIADHLLVKHNSAVELIDRAEQLGLVRRFRDERDHRIVRLALTGEGERRLAALSETHLEELLRLSGTFAELDARL